MEPLTAALLFCSTAQPGPYPPASAVVDAFVEAYNRHDVSDLARLLTKDAVIDAGDEMISGEDLAVRYRDTVFPRFPTVRIEIRKRLAATDLVAETEWVTVGGDKGEGGVAVYRVKHGCIVGMAINGSEQDQDAD